MAKKSVKKKPVKRQAQKPTPEAEPKTFLEMIAPTAVSFSTDHYILGSTYRCVLALRSYPAITEDAALLRRLGEKSGVTVHIYTRKVSAAESNQIIQNAENRNRMESSTNNVRKNVTAEDNLQDVRDMVRRMTRESETLFHCAVFVELIAKDPEEMKNLLDEVTAILIRAKIGFDRLLLKQQDGFRSVNPAGHNCFKAQFERVLPVSSVANLYPLNHSGKNDPHGFYIGRDRYGSDIIVDLDRRADDKTNGSAVILGNSGQGKSYLLKLLLCNLLESGKSALCFDPEHEDEELCLNLGGCFVDLMSGQYLINILEPKSWGDGDSKDDDDAPTAFRRKTKLSQHISFLKDVFRAYKDFSDQQIDAIEIMLGKLYARWGIHDGTDFRSLKPTDYPTLSDLYALIEQEYQNYEETAYPLYTAELLQSILLGLHSMCVGAESKFFNGHTNIADDRFLVFGVKDLLRASRNVRDAMLLNILSYLSDRLLSEGNAVAVVDELYLFLANPIAIEYIRNCMKRARKKDSAMILASQNLEDFAIPGIAELTKPLFSIPTHTFLFNAGQIDKQFYVDALQLKNSEYELIRYPQRGVCLYKCGVERYLLEVHAPPHKEKLFGTAGGR